MSYQLINDVPVWGEPLQNAVDQIVNCKKGAANVALMADHHLGYAVPIGGVVAYRNKVSPSGVGYDIACGNKAVRLDANVEDVKKNIPGIMDAIFASISFGVGRSNKERVSHALFEDDPAWDIQVARSMKDLARQQLGTVGSGNHFVDVFEDENNAIWVGAHFGSRGLGHKLATHFLKAAGGRDGMNVDPVTLEVESQLGKEYIACMNLAGRYAYAGRDWVCSKVASIMGAEIVEEIHNHHNFAWKEKHFGQDVIVHRKGATPAGVGVLGIIPGSMASPAFVVRGKGKEESMKSASHGAGRVMSRTQALRTFSWDDVKQQLDKAGVTLLSSGLDEVPGVYKNIHEVMDFQRDLVEILATFHPRLVKMAPPEGRGRKRRK